MTCLLDVKMFTISFHIVHSLYDNIFKQSMHIDKLPLDEQILNVTLVSCIWLFILQHLVHSILGFNPTCFPSIFLTFSLPYFIFRTPDKVINLLVYSI